MSLLCPKFFGSATPESICSQPCRPLPMLQDWDKLGAREKEAQQFCLSHSTSLAVNSLWNEPQRDQPTVVGAVKGCAREAGKYCKCLRTWAYEGQGRVEWPFQLLITFGCFRNSSDLRLTGGVHEVRDAMGACSIVYCPKPSSRSVSKCFYTICKSM